MFCFGKVKSSSNIFVNKDVSELWRVCPTAKGKDQMKMLILKRETPNVKTNCEVDVNP